MTDFNQAHNRAVWFDIPVADVGRAVRFYSGVLAIAVVEQNFNGVRFAVLEHTNGNGGCLVPRPDEITDKGLLLYLNVDGRIRDAVSKVSELGGEVSEDVQSIGPHGFRAIIKDSEGNRIALHSQTDG